MILTALLPILAAAPSLAAEHQISAEPSAVTVFADRARVTRSAAVSVGSGRQEVVFTDLPARILHGTVTADARGPGVLLGVDLVRVEAAEVADARVAEIEAELQVLQDRRQDELDRVAADQVELQTLTRSRAQSVAALNTQLLVGTRAPDRARDLRTTLADEEATVRLRIREASERRRELDEQIAALQRERSTLGSSATDTWNAVVQLDMDRAGRVAVDLSYVSQGASWVPHYDIRGDAGTGEVELALSAMVQQRSGEDWTGVELTVSSARPGLGTVVPQLDPFWLSRPYRYAVETSSRSRKMSMAAPAMAMEESMDFDDYAPEPEPMQVAAAEVDIQLSATAFTVARPEDVPSDGTERKVLLTTESLTADLRHVVVPRVDPRAWLVGEVTNTAVFPLLPGEAGVFLSGAYLGDFTLDVVAPGDEFDVAFGVDDRVTVKRVPRELSRGDKGVTGRKGRARWQWDVTVGNGHRRAIDVELWEQVPVSLREDVEVKLLDPTEGTPAPTEQDGGLLEFEFPLNAGQKKTIGWGYQVDYPADLQLGWME